MKVWRGYLRTGLMVLLFGTLVVGPAHANETIITKTSFDNYNAWGCGDHYLLGQDPLSHAFPCSHYQQPITKGTATAIQSASADGTFSFQDHVTGGSDLEHWNAVSAIDFDNYVVTDAPIQGVTVTLTYRLDSATMYGIDGGDLGVYGTASIYAQQVDTSEPAVCDDGSSLQATGQTKGLSFLDSTPPGTYSISVRYMCSNGGRITAGEAFGGALTAVGYADSYS